MRMQRSAGRGAAVQVATGRAAMARVADGVASIPRGAWLLLTALPLMAALSGCEGAPAATGAASGYGYVCHAGFYQCTLPAQYPVGSQCQCPGLGAPSYGRVG